MHNLQFGNVLNMPSVLFQLLAAAKLFSTDNTCPNALLCNTSHMFFHRYWAVSILITVQFALAKTFKAAQSYV